MSAQYGTVILLATYNGEEFLRQQIDSLMEQTVSDFTICIHDDGSTDATPDILKDYEEKYPGRFNILPGKPCGGAKANFFYLMEKVEADVYFFCDQDDVWLSDKVEKERDLLSGLGDAPAAVYSDMSVVDENLNFIDVSFLDKLGRKNVGKKIQGILIDNPAAGCTMCFNKQLRDAVVSAGIDVDRIEMHDGFLLCSASLLGEIDYLDLPLVKYRQHGTNEMGAESESAKERIIRNLTDVISGRMRRNRRDFQMISRNMAGELLKLKELSADDRRLLSGYCNLENRTKFGRISFLHKNGFKRAKHTLWFYLWS